MKYFLLIFILFTTLSCMGESESGIPDKLQDKGNLVIIDRDTSPLHSIEFTKSTVIDIGSYSGSGQSISFTVHESNTIVVADDSQNKILVFDEQGTYLGGVGREGSGPGEFRAIVALESLFGQVYIYDPELLRVSILRYNPGNNVPFEFDQVIQLTADMWKDIKGADLFYPTRFFVRNEDSFLLGSSTPVSGSGELSERQVYYYLFDSTGIVRPEKVYQHRNREFYKLGNSNQPVFFPFPFLRKPLFAVSGNNIYYAWTDTFLITVYDENGNYLRSIYHPFSAKEFNRNEVISNYRDGSDNEFLNQSRVRLLQTADLPDTWPALNSMLIDDENRIWVSTIIEDENQHEWWVLGGGGELITRFKWPNDESIEVIKNSNMYTRETDKDTGLQKVMRYRIEIDQS